MGTPDYMAPEQILGQDTDGRADIYALGCVAYFALTGRVPFPNEKDAVALFMAHLQKPPRPLDVPGLPTDMAELILRCMAKAAADRPPSASVIKHALMAVEFTDDDAWTEEAAADFWDRNVPRMATAPSSIGPFAPKSSG